MQRPKPTFPPLSTAQRWTPPAKASDHRNGIDAVLREALVEGFFRTT